MSSSALRFRPLRRNSGKEPPRTPKSPAGAYTGEPLPIEPAYLVRHKAKSIVLLMVVFVLCAGALWFSPQLGISVTTPSSSPRQVIPSFPVYPMSFQDNPAFKHRGKAGAHAWSSMFPPGDGRLAVKSPRDFGLPPSAPVTDRQGKVVPHTELYDVSAIRQLGCLALIRQVLVDYENKVALKTESQHHAFHCLDHVRQAILCAADTTLEPTGNGRAGALASALASSEGTSGFQAARHMCKNWTEVRTWMEENRFVQDSRGEL